MLKKMMTMACMGASLAACGEKPNSLPPPNPNAVSCRAAGSGSRIAAPMTVTSNCWEQDSIQVVLRGIAPKDGETTAFVVKGVKGGQGTLTRHDYPGEDAGCHMKLNLEDLGLECRGNVSGDPQLLCYKGESPKPVCGLSWRITPPYDEYHPVIPFPKYVDDYPED